jgi:ribokinase
LAQPSAVASFHLPIPLSFRPSPTLAQTDASLILPIPLCARSPRPTLGSVSDSILGCGSNVVDRFFKVKGLPKPGEKGYFADPMSITDASVVGGVTLNHLAWCAQLSVPTGGMFLQGDDAAGKMVRDSMTRLGVSTDLVQVDAAYTTAESYVILATDGERSIIMATGATSLITDHVVKKHFSESVGQCRILSTEISQVPLSGVIELLRAANAGSPILSVLDVDVQPSVAVEQALLGSLNEVTECVMLADVLKPAKHAAQELLAHLDPSVRTDAFTMSSQDLTARLRDLTGSQLVALTNGAEGCVLATENHLLTVAPFQLDRVIDATGAGDAFLGGLLAGLYHENGVPTAEGDLYSLGELANATGAANCQVLGALPDGESTGHVRGYLQVTKNKFLGKLSSGK